MASRMPPESCKVYTPRPLAEAMVSKLFKAPEGRWLEPGCGNGAFLETISELGVPKSRIVGVEIDTRPGMSDKFATVFRGQDFLRWANQTELRFDYIVGNPPYVAIDRLVGRMRENALSMSDPEGMKIGAAGNLWYAFLCASIRLLEPGGSIAFVLPSSWEYANYAANLRTCIGELFAEVSIYRSKTPLFESVQEGCVVLISRGYGIANKKIKRHVCSDLKALISVLEKEGGSVRKNGNKPRKRKGVLQKAYSSAVRLGDVVNIRLGGVTGDAKYFVINEERRRYLRLPRGALLPALSKAKHLVSSELTRDRWKELLAVGEKVWLFNPPPALMSHAEVKRYLMLSAQKGGCQKTRLKIATRPEWFRTLLPPTIDGFISGMSSSGPWIAFKRMPRLTATNTLYIVEFREALSNDEKAAYALSLLTSYARKGLYKLRRVYAQQLVKYEPGDLARLEILKPRKSHGAGARYRKAVRAILAGKASDATAIADSWFAS